LTKQLSIESFRFAPTYVAIYHNISHFLLDEVAKRQPDVIVINQGIWRSKLRTSYKEFETVLRSAKLAVKPGGRVVWKRTTAVRDGEQIDDDKFVEFLRQSSIDVFDAYTVTAALTQPSVCQSAFWDRLHFEPFVYRELNLALLDMLCLGFSNWVFSQWPTVVQEPINVNA
jgi:hypothetical protein